MSQTTSPQTEAAEARTEETRAYVRQVRAATRRKYTAEEKIRTVLEGFRREVTVTDLCRREGIKPPAFYAWTKEFMEAGKERLSRNEARDVTVRRQRSLDTFEALRTGEIEGRCRLLPRVEYPAEEGRRGIELGCLAVLQACPVASPSWLERTSSGGKSSRTSLAFS